VIKSINIDEVLYRQIRVLTVQQGTSVSAVITKLLKQYLEDNK
jgi:negative regulator of replication initiation